MPKSVTGPKSVLPQIKPQVPRGSVTTTIGKPPMTGKIDAFKK